MLVGTLHRYYLDPLEGFGDYFHANVEVSTPRGVYRCLLDVDQGTPAGLLWRVVDLGPIERLGVLAWVIGLPDGWHDLEPTRHSGALDYLRSPELHPKASSSDALVDHQRSLPRLARVDRGTSVWRQGTTQDTLADLERLLEDQTRLYVFGEPFSRGRGVHNVHQNQGDPPGSRWWAENGCWQDGGLIVRRRDGSLFAFLVRFRSQAARTDRKGHPA